MFKIMKGYKIFAFTPPGKSLKKTLPSSTVTFKKYDAKLAQDLVKLVQ